MFSSITVRISLSAVIRSEKLIHIGKMKTRSIADFLFSLLLARK